jgi:DNA-binding CsgD family transcriptional regulator
MGIMLSLKWLAAALTLGGELAPAVEAGEEAVALCDARGDAFFGKFVQLMLAIALWRSGETARARELAVDNLAYHRSLGNPIGIGFNLALLTWIAASDGQYERAARLLGILDAFSRRPGSQGAIGALVDGYRHLGRYHDPCTTEIRHRLVETAVRSAVRRSARLGVDQALAYALEGPPTGAKAGAEDRTSPLTHRETQVARLIARGLTNKDIAAELMIAQRTAEGHVEHILTKLGLGSRAQIARWIRGKERPAGRAAGP